MAVAIEPLFKVTYEGKNITEDISRNLISLTYTDRLANESDELEIVLEDSDGLWKEGWYPQKKDKISAEIGYPDFTIPCGTFTIDEITLSGPPDTVTIRALAAGINSPLRTKKSAAHENKTLKQIAQAVADANGLTLVDGTAKTTHIKIDFTTEKKNLTDAAKEIRNAYAINSLETFLAAGVYWYPIIIQTAESLGRKGRAAEAAEIRQTADLWRQIFAANGLPAVQDGRDIANDFAARLDKIATSLKNQEYDKTTSKLDVKIERSTQDRETDLGYLNRVAARFGIVFSVRGSDLIFIARADLLAAGGIMAIDKAELSNYSLSDKSVKTFKAAKVSHHHADTKETISATATAGADISSEDTLEIKAYVENQKQAEEMAGAALTEHNTKGIEGSITTEGRPLLLAGVNFQLTGLGKLSRKYHITSSSHRIDKSGSYSTTVEIKSAG